MFPFDMIQDYPSSAGYVLRVRIVKYASGFVGEGFIELKDESGDMPIPIPVPDDSMPVSPVKSAEDAKRPWTELARTCGYEIAWSEGDD